MTGMKAATTPWLMCVWPGVGFDTAPLFFQALWVFDGDTVSKVVPNDPEPYPTVPGWLLVLVLEAAGLCAISLYHLARHHIEKQFLFPFGHKIQPLDLP